MTFHQTVGPKPETCGPLLGSCIYSMCFFCLNSLCSSFILSALKLVLQSHTNCIGDRPLKGCHGDQQSHMPHASLAFLTFAKALLLAISFALFSSFMHGCASSTFPLHSIQPLIISHYSMRIDESVGRPPTRTSELQT